MTEADMSPELRLALELYDAGRWRDIPSHLLMCCQMVRNQPGCHHR